MTMGPVPVSSPVNGVTDLLENLQVEPQSEHPQTPDGNTLDSSSGEATLSNTGDYTGHEVNPESGVFYTNGYATYTYDSYDYAQGGTEWEDYPRYVGLNGLDPSIYQPENGGTVVYQTGYGYAAQAYAPYSPSAYVYADGQLYGQSGYHFATPVYQGQYPVTTDASVKDDGIAKAEGQQPGYPVTFLAPYGHYARGVMSVQSGSRQELRASAPAWVDMRSSENRRPPKTQAHQQSQPQQKAATPPAYPGALGTAFPPLNRAVLSASGKGGRVQNGSSVDLRTKGEARAENSSSVQDVTSEQNRGPRTSKARFHRIFPVLKQHKDQSTESAETLDSLVARDEYNKVDFPTSYNDAKFYIIKSYSEDDVHKSIKYCVWASTPNGNKRLDAAYQAAQGKAGECPVFLFFSVNASGQFCGVAEMTGPVDFVKSMDFWQQDKWSGRFSVKWHIIKDIPNFHFRHIILENNDNKPVTNSRDTQEVQFAQGVEMLNIFKSYPCYTSILDDFQFYENRQKLMQENRSRQQQQEQQQQDVGVQSEKPKPVEGSSGKLKEEKAATVVPTKKSYLGSLAGDKDVTKVVDVKAA